MISHDISRTFLDTVRATLEEHRMTERGSKLVIGVSGGPDSVALLHVLYMLASELDLSIVVAHLDHSLRPESAQDADFVKRMTEDLGLECHAKTADVRSIASDMGISIEEAGRHYRYAYFEEVRTSATADIIATAHHKDDELETFFLRLCRGSSLKGLCGIPAVRGNVIRPLIRIKRTAILEFLQNERIPYRTDRTNLGTESDRNYIRNRLIPVITERFPKFQDTLGRTILTLSREDNYLEELFSSIYERAVVQRIDELIMDMNILREAAPVLVSRVIIAALYNFSGPKVRWSQKHVDLIRNVLWGNNPSTKVALPSGIRLSREYDKIKLHHLKPEDSPDLYPITVEGPGSVVIGPGYMTLSFRVFDRGIEHVSYASGANTVFFDADKAAFPMVLRSPRPGDRFRPWGLDGTRKVKKVLIDVKVPLRVRKKLMLLEKDNDILWIPGIRRGEAAPVENGTRRILEAQLVEEDILF